VQLRVLVNGAQHAPRADSDFGGEDKLSSFSGSRQVVKEHEIETVHS